MPQPSHLHVAWNGLQPPLRVVIKGTTGKHAPGPPPTPDEEEDWRPAYLAARALLPAQAPTPQQEDTP